MADNRKPGDRILLDGLDNARDLGGYLTMDGRHIRMHRLIRSGAMNKATKKDIEILTGEYQLKKIIDFRTGAEAGEKPDPVIEGVEYIHNPILNEAQMGMTHAEKEEGFGLLSFLVDLIRNDPDGPEKFMSDMYAQLVTEEGTIGQYRKFFDLLLAQEKGAVLWHCSAGKDRAGTGAVLLLWALGVDEALIRRDYLLTDIYLKESLDALIAQLAKQVPDEKVLEGVRIMNTARESYLDRLLDTVKEQYGSMDTFLSEKLGIREREKAELCRKYLE